VFATLLTNLQNLISTRFVVSSFFPSLAFWFVNATLAYFLDAPFHDYATANAQLTAGFPALLAAAALIGIGLFAYAEYALLPTIQALLEGNWPKHAVWFFAPAQSVRYEEIVQQRAENRRMRGSFRTGAGGQSQAERWRSALRTARQEGAKRQVNTYSYHTSTARTVKRLAALRRAARPIPGSEIDTIVAQLVMELRANNADMPSPNNDNALDEVHTSLVDLIDYAEKYSSAEARALVARQQFSFGSLPLAPTRMGNVARTVQAYAINRYELNFELLWSRLQFLAQRDKDFGPTLQAAKTQLDFLVSCSVLSFVASIGWALWLRLTHGPAVLFLIVALAGPLAGYVWYRVAVAQYAALADLLRGAIDLFRFDLLTALHFPLPDGVEAERFLWDRVDALHLLGEMRDLKLTAPTK
jgi:hypothetical protein